MNFLKNLKTLTLALILSLGISYAYAAWAPPSVAPTGGNTDAPVNVGNVTQVKGGGLGVTGLLEVGIPSGAGSLLMKTYGNIGADKYCDRDGNNCIAATALGGAGGIGVGQTWQDVTASRAINGPVYQNTTGKPIVVSIDIIRMQIGWGGVETKVLVGPTSPPIVRVGYVAAGYPANGQDEETFTVIVPDGNYYQVFGNSLRYWTELR